MNAKHPLEPIPVTLITEPGHLVPLDAETALLRLPANSGHGHADGEQCIACAMRTDVRALLYNLLEDLGEQTEIEARLAALKSMDRKAIDY